jgi:hypothetical protein
VPEAIRGFDIDDHKFFAVAIADGGRPLMYQALDREWWDRRRDLHDAGLSVQFACPADLI